MLRILAGGLLGLIALALVLAAFIVTQASQDSRPVVIVTYLGFFTAALVAAGRGRGIGWLGGLAVAVAGIGAGLLLSKFDVAFTDHAGSTIYLVAAVIGVAAGLIVRWTAARTRAYAAALGVLLLVAVAIGAVGGLPWLREQQAYATLDKAIAPFTVRTLDGATVSSASWRGRVVVVSYWATWCTPCMAELPKIAALQAKYRSDPRVAVVAVDAGYGGDTAERARSFLQRRNLALSSHIDDIKTPGVKTGAGGTSLGLEVVPTLFILDPAGRLVAKHVGYDNAEDLIGGLSRRIERLVAERRS
jgi:thiol-disulfide isomerase/thioredoxin